MGIICGNHKNSSANIIKKFKKDFDDYCVEESGGNSKKKDSSKDDNKLIIQLENKLLEHISNNFEFTY